MSYWRDDRDEVDFVVSSGSALVALEVKSGRHTGTFAGLDRFRREHAHARTLIVGSTGIPLEEFLSAPTEAWLR